MVLVCHKHKFIFIKTHKTASTSVETVFEPFCAAPGHKVQMAVPETISVYGIIGAREGANVDQQNKPYWQGHIGAKKISKGLKKSQWREYRKITSVRNPFDRAVSKFLYRRRWQGKPELNSIDELRAEFDDFFNNGEHRSDYYRVHIRKFGRFRYIIDRVIRYETLAEDCTQVASELGLGPIEPKMPHMRANVDARLGYATPDFFDKRRADIVRHVDAWLFDQCGYSSNPNDST